MTLGYSHFFAGDMIDDVKGDDDGADWFYLMTTVKIYETKFTFIVVWTKRYLFLQLYV